MGVSGPSPDNKRGKIRGTKRVKATTTKFLTDLIRKMLDMFLRRGRAELLRDGASTGCGPYPELGITGTDWIASPYILW